jgi:hypothetical protein
MSNILTLTAAQLRQAADIKEKIASLENELAAILGATAPAVKIIAGKPKKHKMSAAGRAAISAAAKARWAKVKGAKPVTKAPAKKRTMSAAAKAKISLAAKARWAKIKAAKKA